MNEVTWFKVSHLPFSLLSFDDDFVRKNPFERDLHP
jgi:hypothetical protein